VAHVLAAQSARRPGEDGSHRIPFPTDETTMLAMDGYN